MKASKFSTPLTEDKSRQLLPGDSPEAVLATLPDDLRAHILGRLGGMVSQNLVRQKLGGKIVAGRTVENNRRVQVYGKN